MTVNYSAGLDAKTIIWISPKFTEEHRAALDLLNRITDESFQCFGIEIELYRIGSSCNLQIKKYRFFAIKKYHFVKHVFLFEKAQFDEGA